MARLLSLLEQHLDRQLSTVVTQVTTWWETVIALVKLQESGLGVNLPVKVHMLFIILSHPVMLCDIMTTHWHMVGVSYATFHISTSFKVYFFDLIHCCCWT